MFTYALFCVAQVWIWDVTMRLDKARTAEAEVAVLRERLRFAGDLHDIQGHQLQAIALKAQLAARLIGVDDELARRHAGDAHALALEALGETRELVQGYRRVGLADRARERGRASSRRRASRRRSRARRRRCRSRCSRCSARSCARGRRTCCATPVAERCEIAVEREGDEVVVRMADDGVAREAVTRTATAAASRACASASRPSAGASRPRRWPPAASS